ncbi:endonuclease III [Phycisphaerae bacterium]|nr:endonuclease III [Phycisphaerae bacterium]
MAMPAKPVANSASQPLINIKLPRITPKRRARAEKLLAALHAHYPNAICELNYTTPHELLIATILSAQTTDVAVNKVTPALFKAFPTPAAFAAAMPDQIEPYIKSIGLFRNKAKAVHAAMTTLMQDFKGQVPQTMDELLTLRGVARKTANVVLGNAFNINAGFVVDTHIDRLSKRLALAPKDATIAAVEQWLMAQFPQDQWCQVSHMLIWHGRRACKARMACCCEHEICREFGDACELGKK